jgi:hypothetical protein
LPQTVPNPTHHFFGSGRIFHDSSNSDQFWIGYSYEHRSVENQSVGGTTLPSAGTDTQLRFLVGHFDAPVISVTASPQIAVSGLFTAGRAQADSRRIEYHFDGTDSAGYANGKHQLSFGIDIPDISRRGLDDFSNRATKADFLYYLGVRYCWQNYFHDVPRNLAPLFGQPVAARPPRRMELDVQFKF